MTRNDVAQSQCCNRIIHGLGALVAGGAERAAVDLVLGLKDKGFAVEVVCLTSRVDPVGACWRRLLDGADVPVHTGPTTSLRPSTITWLASILRSPSVSMFHVHLNYVEVAYYFSRFLHKRRYVVLRKLHTSKIPDRGLYRWVYDHSDVRLSVAGGEATHSHLLGRFSGRQVCIPNGINFHWPVNVPSQRPRYQRELRLAEGQQHFVCVGSMSGRAAWKAQKAHDTLIRAWQRARMADVPAQLHLLGDGNLRGILAELPGSDPSIHFHGIQPGVERWLLACDAFVLPSRWEGLPNAGIEATATGIPCIFSDIPPCREIAYCGTRFFPVDNVDALADQLRAASTNVSPLCDMDSVNRLRDRFGIARTVQAYEELYREVSPASAPISDEQG